MTTDGRSTSADDGRDAARRRSRNGRIPSDDARDRRAAIEAADVYREAAAGRPEPLDNGKAREAARRAHLRRYDLL